MPTEDDREQVVTVAEDESPKPMTTGRVGTAAILRAIEAIPAAVAAQVKGAPAPKAGAGTPEVVFKGEPPPEPDENPQDAIDEDPSTGPQADPNLTVHRPRWRHPSAKRRRSEALS